MQQEIKGNNFLVTGGLGFLGGSLGFDLSKDNNIIVPARQQINSTPFILHNCDICDYERLRNIVIKEQVNFIFHFANLGLHVIYFFHF
jgi:UDP-glucose 4-epimerase